MGGQIGNFLHPYFELWKQLVIAIVVFTAAIFAPPFVNRWFRGLEALGARFATRKRIAIWAVFLTPVIVRVLLLPAIPPPVPQVHDESSYLLLADTFAHGRLANPPHPLWMSFETFHVNFHPTYSSMFAPAQGFVLALGQMMGHPWAGVVLSVGAMCAAIFWMLLAWMPARWALLGGVMAICNLGIVSYWMDSYWGGAVAATGGALVLGALPRILRKQQVRDSLLLGMGMAILANSRPYEGFIACIPVAVTLLFRLVTQPSLRAKASRILVPLGAVLALTTSFVLYYNWRLTGDALLFPHSLNQHTYLSAPLFLWQHAGATIHYNNRQFQDFYAGPVASNYHGTWLDFVRESWHKASYMVAVFLWIGALPALLWTPLAIGDRRIRLLLVVFVVGMAGLLCVVYSQPHYAAPLTCVVYALLIQGLRHLRTLRFAGRAIGLALSRAVVVLVVLATVSGTYRLIRYPESPYPWSWNRGGGVENPARKQLAALPGKQLVVVRYEVGHNPNGEWVYNSADIDGSKIVWARELNPEQNQRLLSYFKDRQKWLFEPDRKPMRLSPYPERATQAP
jgi:hypothetical protein